MAAIRRLRKELCDIADGKESETFFALMPLDPANVLQLRGIIMATEGSPMEGYILFLDITIPEEYPFKPPMILFKNKVWHPKISEDRGYISLSVITPENWKPCTKLETVLVSVQAMLGDPGEAHRSGPLNKLAWDQYLNDRATYVKTSRSWTERDNEGYGHVTLSDYRISAIQSVLKVVGVVDYEASVFCNKVDELTWKLFLVIVPNLRLYRQRAQLLFQQYHRLTTFHFAFEEEEITLNFGDGMTRDNCWKITAISLVRIRKEDVISDLCTTQPFTCDLEMHWMRTEIKPQRVIHRFSLIGSKSPEFPLRLFDVCIDPDSFVGPSTHTRVPTAEKPKLRELLNFPRVGKCHVDIIQSIGRTYYTFGVLLLKDDTGCEINNIALHMSGDPHRIVLEIMTRWLSGKGRQPITWKTLAKVLHDIHLSDLAKDIEVSKHLL